MSLGTWIKEEEAKIALLFEGAETEVEKVILPAAIAVTKTLKTIVIADSTDIIGTLAGSAGAAFEDKVRGVLPNIITDLQLAQAFLASNPTTDQLIAETVKIGVGLTGNARTSFLIEFSGAVATAIADGKLTVAQSVVLVQGLYAQLASETETKITSVEAAIPAATDTQNIGVAGEATEPTQTTDEPA